MKRTSRLSQSHWTRERANLLSFAAKPLIPGSTGSSPTPSRIMIPTRLAVSRFWIQATKSSG